MNRKPRIALLAVMLTIGAFSCALIFSSCNNRGKNKIADYTASEQMQRVDISTVEQKPAFDDILAVAYNAVKGTVRSVTHHVDNVKIILDVEKVYVTDEGREMNGATVSVAYSSDDLELTEGDECIIIVSQSTPDAVSYHTDASYLAIRPEYNIIMNSENGWCAEKFMSIADSHAYSPDKQYYELTEIERVLVANSEKFKAYGALQLVPPY